jgi:HPr kinase/phosphorylase
MAISVKELFEKHGQSFGLAILAGQEGMKRRIKVPEVHRPGLALAGFVTNYARKRILILGKIELDYIRNLSPLERREKLANILTAQTPAVILTRRYKPPLELLEMCQDQGLPLFGTHLITMQLLNKMMFVLNQEFAPSVHCHGTFVEVFGIGVLIQGISAAGKSESALGLIERGHRLISDDIVKIHKREDSYLEGSAMEFSKHHMEIRGIGIINVAYLYGAICVCDKKKVDLVIKLEEWDDSHFYDRIGLEDKFCDILGVRLPYHILPVKPGRDVVLLIETIALNHRLKELGYHSAREFNAQLLEQLRQASRKTRRG